MEIKAKVNKWALTKLKSFYIAKETISKVKRQPSEWEKIIANETTDKGLISKYTSSSYNSMSQKQTTQSKNGEKAQTFLQKDIQMANKHMKRCSASLIIREMQNKTTMRYHLTLVRMAIIKKSLQKINAGKSVEKSEHSCTVGGNAN